MKTVLHKQIRRMKYFFFDFESKGFGAPDGFVVAIMVSLDATLYTVGDQILKRGQNVEDVYFIIQGNCSLSARFLKKDKDTRELMTFNLVTLHEGSWYGDYQDLLNTKSYWDFHVSASTKKQMTRIA